MKKKTGSYYTPDFLSSFILDYISPFIRQREDVSILEPSVGDGSFIRAFKDVSLVRTNQTIDFLGVEKIKKEILKAQRCAENITENVKFSFVHSDFLTYSPPAGKKFSLVVGNPPYIKKSFLTKRQVEICEGIHKQFNLSNASVKNIWPYFLIKSCQLLTEDGVLAFVLPAELLQVDFAKEIRSKLLEIFARIEVFTFDDLLFDCKGQDTVLLFAFKQHTTPGQFFAHISSTGELMSRSFILKNDLGSNIDKIKWTHHSLSSEEIEFIFKAADSFKPIGDFCESKPGIVTAANDFFIVDEITERFYELTSYVRPIIQKAYYVNGGVVFNPDHYLELVESKKRTKVLVIEEHEINSLPQIVKDYLRIGVAMGLPNNYKCKRRPTWFVIPNIPSTSAGFFLRRVHHYPKLIRNDAKVLLTDTAYLIDMKANFSLDSLIFSFYNPISLIFTELLGRYYGGGVLELTPKEFKKIPVPYIQCSSANFEAFSRQFTSKGNIGEILYTHGLPMLAEYSNINLEDFEKMISVLGKLVSKRLRNTNQSESLVIGN